MSFNSLEFIYVFLPLCLAGYFLCGRSRRAALPLAWLVLASLVYYGWSHPQHVLVILASCLVNHGVGLKLAELGRKGAPAAKWLLALAVAANLGLLAYYKYTLFFLQNLNYWLSSPLSLPQMLWPLGISFFTFQQVAYLVDIRRGGPAETSLLSYLLEVAFFPKLLAGPIVRHREMAPQLRQAGLARFDHQRLAEGLALVVEAGLFKKAVMADGLAPHISQVFDAAAKGQIPNFGRSWLAVLAYTLQIYYDFSGYSDMAIGLARMMGLALPFNFDSPYKSRNIAEFWRRWHITLSSFLRDYLYISLGGNRRGQGRRYLNLIVTMLLGGLWHGAGWTFVI